MGGEIFGDVSMKSAVDFGVIGVKWIKKIV